MNNRGNPLRVPSAAIAVSAALLGAMITVMLAPAVPLYSGARSHAVGLAALSALAIAALTSIVIALVLLKSRADHQYQTDRELLEAFLEHIPDNVFFKDRQSRFIRISRA